jgi:hypothetical protein
MIIGSCAYEGCDEPLMINIPDIPMPAFFQHDCEGCGMTMWTKFSRVDPESYTEENFIKEYTIDEKTKQIRNKEG